MRVNKVFVAYLPEVGKVSGPFTIFFTDSHNRVHRGQYNPEIGAIDAIYETAAQPTHPGGYMISWWSFRANYSQGVVNREKWVQNLLLLIWALVGIATWLNMPPFPNPFDYSGIKTVWCLVIAIPGLWIGANSYEIQGKSRPWSFGLGSVVILSSILVFMTMP